MRDGCKLQRAHANITMSALNFILMRFGTVPANIWKSFILLMAFSTLIRIPAIVWVSMAWLPVSFEELHRKLGIGRKASFLTMRSRAVKPWSAIIRWPGRMLLIDRRVITGITQNPITGCQSIGFRACNCPLIRTLQLYLALPALLDDWGEVISSCQSIGLHAPPPHTTTNNWDTSTGVVGGFGIIPVITLWSIASAVANCKQLSPHKS